jgi:hypothetical protein
MQLGKPSPVFGLGLIVEQLPGITQTGDMDSGLLEIFNSSRQPWTGVSIPASAR